MPKIKARYRVTGPRKENVTYNKCHIDKTGSLQQEEVTEQMDCYMVSFPMGHSIRVTSFELLKQLGFHVKPRMVDMETGDVIDAGGDPYDFSDATTNAEEIVLDEDDLTPGSAKRAKAA